MSTPWALDVLQGRVAELTLKLAAADARGDILSASLAELTASRDLLSARCARLAARVQELVDAQPGGRR